MKYWLFLLFVAASLATSARAATINWSAGIDHGFSLENGSELPIGSLVRLGWFRDSTSGGQMTDAQIQALKTRPTDLDSRFVEAGRSTIGSGFMPAKPGHFSAATTLNMSTTGSSLVGKQMYLWVLNASTVSAATQQAIIYWSIADTATNPDGTSDTPGTRWLFPALGSFPGSTTIDLTDLTTGSGSLSAGAHLVVGTYPKGASNASGNANFGLADLYQNPAVATPQVLAGGSVGAIYSQALAAIEGTPTYLWEVTGGALPAGLSMTTAGLISGRPVFPGVFTFMARASDQVPNSVSKEFTITVASTPLVITSAATLPEGGQDSLYALNLTASGGVAPYEWRLISGTLPLGMTLGSGGLLSGTPTGAGSASFVMKCTDAAALETTKAFTMNVQALSIATGEILNNAFLNVPYSLTLVANGGKAPYVWTLVDGALPSGALPSSAGVLSFRPSTVGVSTFTLQVQDAANRTVTRQFTLTVLNSLIAPSVNTPTFPTAIVGGIFSYKLSGLNNPTKFIATGLPTGLVLNATTGVISGRSKVTGVFTVQIQAINAVAPSNIKYARLEVQALPTGAVGTFIGSVAHNSSVNGNLGGRLDLTTTNLGGYTLKLTQGAKVTTLTGLMDVSTTGSPMIKYPSQGTPTIALTIDAASNTLVGTITGAGVGASSTSVAGWRRVWNSLTNPASSYIGFYSMGIDHTSGGDARPVPEGTGFAYCVVYPDGAVTVTGKTADGNVIATPGFIGPSGELLVHQPMYSNLGSMAGRLVLTPGSGGQFAENSISGLLTWLKPATVSRSYPRGFGPLSLAVFGKYLASNYQGWDVIGMPSSGQLASLNFAGGGVERSFVNPNVQFVYTDARKVVLPVIGGVENPGKTTLSIPYFTLPWKAPGANGQFSGAFQLVDGTVKRDVTYQGMIVRTADTSTKAFGYFLLPQIPVPPETSTNSPILSGQVSITQ